MDLVFVNLVYIHLDCTDLVNGDIYIDIVHTLMDFDWLMVPTSLY